MTTCSGALPDQRRVAIELSHLRKIYGATVAVDDGSFTVRVEEIFGILGPNGAGMTTTVECLVGLRSPDSGTIRVLGLDPQRDDEREELHARVGVQLQSSALLDEMMTGLDPQALLLVTHSMEEAERLCDRVALTDRGRVVAIGSPSELAAEAGGGKHVRFVPSRPFNDRLLTDLPEVKGVEHQGQHILVTGTGELVNAVSRTLAGAGVTANDVSVSSATFEDAFAKLTGRHLRDESTESQP